MNADLPISTRIVVSDSNSIGTARRAAHQLATRTGFGELERGEVEIVATELATNLAQHGRGGQLLLRPLGSGATAGGDEQRDPSRAPFGSTVSATARIGIELLAIDAGPGIADTLAAGRDGWSSAGTLGLGLGAIRRLSKRTDLYSRPGAGTVLVAQLWSPSDRVSAPGARALALGAICLPCRGETECGDAWSFERFDAVLRLFVVDGLGHGPDAASAARIAVQSVRASRSLAPVAILERLHAALRSTRGAAAGLAEIDLERKIVRYSGVGNTVAAIVDGTTSRRLVSHNGTLGHVAGRIQEFHAPWSSTSLLIMHTDGLSQRWNLDAYAGISRHHPALVAGVLYRDHARDTDDATVVVLGDGERGAVT